MSKKPSFEIVLGSYEEFLLGFKYNKKEEELAQTFATHTHTGSIRSVSISENLMASGGADDRIVVYDLKSRKEHCMLTHHNGTINCLAFTKGHTHLISGSQEGMLAIVRVGNWQLEKVWESAHKGAAVLAIAVHDSGKMALTLGADCTLRTWNLIKGRLAYAINLNSKCKDPRSLHSVHWAPDGVRFTLTGGLTVYVWSIESGGILKSFELKSKVSSCAWKSDNTLILGCEDGTIVVVDIESGTETAHEAHNSRVKCVMFQDKRIVSACSGGEIKIWNGKMEELASANAGCRFTCMCTIPLKKGEDVQKIEDTREITTVTSGEASKNLENNPPKKRQKVVVIMEDTKRKKNKKIT